jgi:ATP-dependent phosphofructokinase / diphosphate-dependent phosphofructokinase
MSNDKKRIGISTGGGDAPALNAVIRAAVRTALSYGWEVYGILNGFEGLLDPKRHIKKLGEEEIKGILVMGGTILGTTNRGNPFAMKKIVRGKETEVDRSQLILKNFKKLKLDGIIVIGGDGTLSIANRIFEMGIPVVGVPKTIDNDLSCTSTTFGFDTAVSTATDALDRLHSTAESHRRVMVVEVMGRNAGWIALHSGVAGGADVILIPEIPFEMKHVVRKIQGRYASGREFAIVVVAEGAAPKGGLQFTKVKSDGEVRLGGIGEWVAREIEKTTGRETRNIVLGHLQRGGRPTTFDRLLATRFGAASVRLFKAGFVGQMVALDPPDIVGVPLAEAIKRIKLVPTTSDIVLTARELGICFGDQ